MSEATSIRALIPLNIGGRHARMGFSYQDHIAVGFCIDFLRHPNLKEIWLETHEDILLFWEESESTVEFIQVKAINQTSRWSVSTICGNGVPSDSIVKKLLDQDRCSEHVRFRIVSSYDVNQELAVLKKRLNSIERNSESAKEQALCNQIKKKLGDITSPNGKTIDDWIAFCWWQKKSDNIDDLISSNKIELELVLSALGKPVLSDQRDEIYQKILRFCQEASTGDLNIQSDCYKITRRGFTDWIINVIDSLYVPSEGTEKLEQKLKKAKNVPVDYILNAKQLKWDYLQKRLTNDFIQPSELYSLTVVIHGELYKLKIALDNNEVDEAQFHKLCIDKLDEIREKEPFKSKNIPDYILSGYMYELTSKCIHRFRKVES